MARRLIALFIVASLGSVFAAEPAGAKIRQALDSTVDVVLEERSLVEVAEYFQSKLKVDVSFDPHAVAMRGIDPNQALITVKQRGGKLGDGLKAALASQNLHYGIVAGRIFIGNESDVINRQLRQRVSLDGETASLSALVKSLADDTGANIVLDPRIANPAGKATVKLKLRDVPLETAVRLSAEVADFAVVRLNEVLFVTSEERAAKLMQIAEPPAPVSPPAMLPFPDRGFGLGNLVRPPVNR